MNHWTDRLVTLGACPEAVTWAKGYATPAAAWKVCQRGDWMLWLAGKLSGEPGSDGRKPLVLAACACARLALKHVAQGEIRPRVAIETAERWARGVEGVTLNDVRKAAYAAAYAANAAAYAAYAAYAAARAQARAKALAKCADIVRRIVSMPVIH